MDPEACKRRLLEAIEDGDWDEAYAAVEDLREWARKGGFPIIVAEQKTGGPGPWRSIPNLQNIPIHTDLGSQIKDAFVPNRGRCSPGEKKTGGDDED